MQTKHLGLAVLAVSLLIRPAAGQSLADLLEKGIYNQETVGDLDAAIQIYRQVVASGKESRGYAAQAQFRLGMCLLKKGDAAGARAAFEQLVKDYPEQEELAARAREHMPADLELLPAPWTEGELLEYEMKTEAGLVAGSMVLTVEAGPARRLLLQSRMYTPAGPIQHSRVEVERETMKPVVQAFTSSILGESRIEYEGRQARVNAMGKPPAVLALEDATFDNEEAMFLFRRLPLGAGYKRKLPIVSGLGTLTGVDLVESGIEDVQVPAGKFRCHKLELTGNLQVFWIAVDAPRPIVKIGIGKMSFELVSMRRVDTVTSVEYRDRNTGLAFTAAPGWMVKPMPGVNRPAGETSVQMLDPEMKAFAVVWGKLQSAEPGQIPERLRSQVEAKAKSRLAVFADYRVRPESIQPRQVGGQQALSCIADYSDRMLKRPMVEYLVWVQTANSLCQFFAQVPAADFEEFRKRFDPIVETVKLQ